MAYNSSTSHIIKSKPKNEVHIACKNRYINLTVVTIKGWFVKPVEFVILLSSANLVESYLNKKHQYVVIYLMWITVPFMSKVQTLFFLAHSVWKNNEVLMITLPLYHPDFNPTELVFNILLIRPRSKVTRYYYHNEHDFLMNIYMEMIFFVHDRIMLYMNVLTIDE